MARKFKPLTAEEMKNRVMDDARNGLQWWNEFLNNPSVPEDRKPAIREHIEAIEAYIARDVLAVMPRSSALGERQSGRL